ncbi:type II secretion system GspH family protein [Photobacterium profundum]|uniref:type IV pilus modification PilV family protein n=1 Tax=Photobacterium profundum TaxID=74109 RepID=UPI003D0BCBDF
MRANHGFTLIELIIAIVLIGITVAGISTSLFPQSRQSAEIILASRAAELGHAVMDEIISRQFDHNSGALGGLPVCISNNDPLSDGEKRCTSPGDLGPEDAETERQHFNDVDDFHGLSGNVSDVLGEDLSDIYVNYKVNVSVYYDTDLDGKPDLVSGDRKRIDVVVIDPQDNQYQFAVYRGNF